MEDKNIDNFFRKAQFLTSAAAPEHFPLDSGYEVAFAGRSNAGKSSALNVITFQRNLARTSKTPGRTQLINFFNLDEERRLVDLPGYGYAKVPEAMKRNWQQLMEGYLSDRDCLRGLMLMIDCRHPLKEFDIQMLDWAQASELPAHVLLTKADKLSKSAAGSALQKLRSLIRKEYPIASAQLFSALNGQGIGDAHQVLNRWMERDQQDEGEQGEE